MIGDNVGTLKNSPVFFEMLKLGSGKNSPGTGTWQKAKKHLIPGHFSCWRWIDPAGVANGDDETSCRVVAR